MQTPVGFDRQQVAARLRELVGARGFDRVPEWAERLSLDEVDLWTAIDEDSPYQTIEVLVAIVRGFGVDPTWLITGEYSSATHRRAMEEGAAGIAATIDDIVRKRSAPPRILTDIEVDDLGPDFRP